MPHYYYYYTASVTVKSTRMVSYECENCGSTSSYSLTLTESCEKRKRLVSQRSQQREEIRELDAVVLQEALEGLKKQIDTCTANENYGFEKCPRCFYTQSWMLGSYYASELDHRIGPPIGVITTLFAVGAFIAVLLIGENPLPICGVSFLLWIVTITLIVALPRKIENPNEELGRFGVVERKNTPTIVWSDPERVA